jgi:hypothetical protein
LGQKAVHGTVNLVVSAARTQCGSTLGARTERLISLFVLLEQFAMEIPNTSEDRADLVFCGKEGRAEVQRAFCLAEPGAWDHLQPGVLEQSDAVPMARVGVIVPQPASVVAYSSSAGMPSASASAMNFFGRVIFGKAYRAPSLGGQLIYGRVERER